jgi:predicted alpha-1,2-mannosidase
MLRNVIVALLFSVLVASAQAATDDTNCVQFVDPFIGTGGGGNTFPGALVPWGMVSVSPHNDMRSPSGYKYGREWIYGFGHVQISGAGCSDLGNILLTATTGPLRTTEDGYRSHYADEVAQPGYYAVTLADHGIRAEATATTHAGMTRFTFPAGTDPARVLIDVSHALTPSKDGSVRVVSPTEVEGFDESGGFCGGHNLQNVYFVAQFSQPAVSSGTWNGAGPASHDEQHGSDIGAFAEFDGHAGVTVIVKVGISYVSIANARLNLQTEMPGWDFDAVRGLASAAWERELSPILVQGGTKAERTMFYTALYHVLIHPSVFSDVSGQYVTMGRGGVATADYVRYHVYSLWDTYRDVHPFLALVYPEEQRDMVRTMIGMWRESGWLPKWELAANETYVMVGDPAVPVIADTCLAGIGGLDQQAVYEAALKSCTQLQNNPLRPGLAEELKHGYVPYNPRGWDAGSVSVTLENCYADWSLAQLAKALGHEDVAVQMTERSHNYRNLYDPSTGFLRARLADGSWLTPFDPAHGERGYTEGTAWQYAFCEPHDPDGMAHLMGGPAEYVRKLQESIDNGQFTLGNEPDFDYPWMFTYFNAESWRTEKAVREAMERSFSPRPDGIPGNDDCGATSAWYVFAAMGFYPACPGSGQYRIGSPLFDRIEIKLDGNVYPGGGIVIEAPRKDPAGIYIQSATLNGKPYAKPYFTHADLVHGAHVAFTMGSRPAYWAGTPTAPSFAVQPQDRTVTEGAGVTFTAQADGSGPLAYQWQVNGHDVAETAAELTVPVVKLADDGTRYGVTVTSPAGQARSGDAVLHVTPDTTPPRLLTAEVVEGANDRVRVLFSEPLAADSATLAHFAVSGSVSVAGVKLDGSVAILTTSASAPGAAPTLSVKDVRDRSAAGNVLASAEVPIVPQGTGLRAEYFSGRNFSDSVVRRTDPNIDFNWGVSPPAPGMGHEYWSARWTGYLRAPVTGDYAFETLSDDGIRLWVDGKLLVDAWFDQSARDLIGGSSIHLQAGQECTIKVEYYNNSYTAVARLYWTPPGGQERVLPGNYLFTDGDR